LEDVWASLVLVFARLSALFKNLVVYGLGDVANSIVGMLLLPFYLNYLTVDDFGALALLGTVEMVAKLTYRWGVDGAFMRLYYDCETTQDKQRLASTIFWFLATVNGALLAVTLLALPYVSLWLFGVGGYTLALGLQFVNTFVIGFNFLPYHVMRMQGQTRQFAIYTTLKTAVTNIARIILIAGFGQGVLGFVLADLVTTALLMIALAPWYRPLLRWMFSRSVLREALAYGLPRVPHGLANQLMIVGDDWVLRVYGGLGAVGVYSIGERIGLTLKLVLANFEYAWQPFYFETMKRADAKRTFRLVTTYGLAVLVLLEAGLAAIATDVVHLIAKPNMYAAAAFIPWIGLGVVFHGVYLLTSIGLNITKSTRYYPIATATAAATSIVANLVLVRAYGPIGAAWSNALAFGTLAVVAMRLAQRVYPMTYEWGRIARLAIAGAGAYLITWVIPTSLPAWLGFLTRGTLVCLAYPLLLFVLGFYHRDETAFMMSVVTRLRSRVGAKAASAADAPAGGDAAAQAQQMPVAMPHEPAVDVGAAMPEGPLAQDELPIEEIDAARAVPARERPIGSMPAAVEKR
jgi:O-antigen/teichoic acid export membrane protein